MLLYNHGAMMITVLAINIHPFSKCPYRVSQKCSNKCPHNQFRDI